MSSGGKKQATSTTINSSGPPEWAQPYYEQNLKSAFDYSQQPYAPFTG
jgi:hypothetical protein